VEEEEEEEEGREKKKVKVNLKLSLRLNSTKPRGRILCLIKHNAMGECSNTAHVLNHSAI
jgi:hypothetical protein